jgi:hypothetical protein
VTIHSVDKKLRESRFFLDRMHECERVPSRYWERFDFFLSAFLSAARSVDYKLRHERKNQYESWREVWDAKHPAEHELIRFMANDRAAEVHRSGSSRDGSIDLYVTRSELEPSSNEAAGFIPVFSFKMEGKERRVTEVCEQYLDLLGAMVAQFLAENG